MFNSNITNDNWSDQDTQYTVTSMTCTEREEIVQVADSEHYEKILMSDPVASDLGRSLRSSTEGVIAILHETLLCLYGPSRSGSGSSISSVPRRSRLGCAWSIPLAGGFSDIEVGLTLLVAIGGISVAVASAAVLVCRVVYWRPSLIVSHVRLAVRARQRRTDQHTAVDT